MLLEPASLAADDGAAGGVSELEMRFSFFDSRTSSRVTVRTTASASLSSSPAPSPSPSISVSSPSSSWCESLSALLSAASLEVELCPLPRFNIGFAGRLGCASGSDTASRSLPFPLSWLLLLVDPLVVPVLRPPALSTLRLPDTLVPVLVLTDEDERECRLFPLAAELALPPTLVRAGRCWPCTGLWSLLCRPGGREPDPAAEDEADEVWRIGRRSDNGEMGTEPRLLFSRWTADDVDAVRMEDVEVVVEMEERDECDRVDCGRLRGCAAWVTTCPDIDADSPSGSEVDGVADAKLGGGRCWAYCMAGEDMVIWIGGGCSCGAKCCILCGYAICCTPCTCTGTA